ncbi:hypothetical protein [Kordia zhangzhouensis]|uniref:hypothetical protein n=1 Tax=Kordia zhangzhouensis TaxID=1620405 RepID=UPI0006291725|nr:hypothetical protein [Kordia zhangzhouensis]
MRFYKGQRFLRKSWNFINLDYRVQAGALQFAILVAAIIAVLLSVFIVLVHSYSLFEKKSDLLIETVVATENSILAELDDFSIKRDTLFKVIDEERNITSKVQKNYWGVFGKVYAQTKVKGKAFEKMALTSGFQSNNQRTSLYLKETHRPLIVVGNTKIEGKVFLPERGIRAGTISGNSYYGTKLIYGRILKSSETLPKFPTQLKNHIEMLQKMPLPVDDKHFIEIRQGKTYVNSFTKPVKTVFSNEELDLVNMQLIGNILIRSNTKIKVAASATLKDVILIAPIIEIEANVQGTFQAIASEQILVGKDCKLFYPSALVLTAEDDLEEVSNKEVKKHIFIDQHTEVKGLICFLQGESKNHFEPQIMLKENTLLEGVVYCQQQLELLGNVAGSVYTGGFITKQFGSVYQNHIYNGTISSLELSENYVGFPLENLEQKVMKWLY